MRSIRLRRGTAPEQPGTARFTARIGRLTVWYAAAVTGVAVIAVVIATVLIDTGEIAHVSLHTTAAPTRPLPSVAPGAVVGRAWTSTDTTALGAPYTLGVVVTYDQHTVRGRDATTGQVRWSLTRTDRTVCTAVQQSGSVIVVYADGPNCDQATMLATDTGTRTNERTLKDDGHPAYVSDGSLLITVTPATLHAIHFGDGFPLIDAWDDSAPPGCSYVSAVVGSSGVLDSQHCSDGDYLELRKSDVGDSPPSGTSKDAWRIKSPAVPVGADAEVSAIEPADGALQRYGSNGGVTASLVLAPRPSFGGVGAASTGTIANPRQGPVSAALDNGQVIWLGGHTYAISADGGRVLWSAPTSGPPTLTPVTPGTITQTLDGPAYSLATALVVAQTASGVVVLDAATGAVRRRYPGAAAGPGVFDTAYAVGGGVLRAGDTTEVDLP